MECFLCEKECSHLKTLCLNMKQKFLQNCSSGKKSCYLIGSFQNLSSYKVPICSLVYKKGRWMAPRSEWLRRAREGTLA